MKLNSGVAGWLLSAAVGLLIGLRVNPCRIRSNSGPDGVRCPDTLSHPATSKRNIEHGKIIERVSFVSN